MEACSMLLGRASIRRTSAKSLKLCDHFECIDAFSFTIDELWKSLLVGCTQRMIALGFGQFFVFPWTRFMIPLDVKAVSNFQTSPSVRDGRYDL